MRSEPPPPAGEFTCESLFGGRLRVRQPRQGYRFSVDAVLLAHFAEPEPGARIVDLGTGCGILPLILSLRRPGLSGTAIEIQPRLAALARENFAANGLQESWRVVEHDFRRLPEVLPAGSCHWAICNPPYRRAGASRCNPMPEQALARHELCADLPALAAALRHALMIGGRAALIYPAARLAALLAVCRSEGLEPKRMQVVHAYPGGAGRLVLVEAVKGGREELHVLPPFFIYCRKNGSYSPAMASLYQPESC